MSRTTISTLRPSFANLPRRAGYHAVLVKSTRNDDDLILAADWVLVTNNPAVLENPAMKVHSAPIAARTGLRPWTDDYNNLLQILRSPQVSFP